VVLLQQRIVLRAKVYRHVVAKPNGAVLARLIFLMQFARVAYGASKLQFLDGRVIPWQLLLRQISMMP